MSPTPRSNGCKERPRLTIALWLSELECPFMIRSVGILASPSSCAASACAEAPGHWVGISRVQARRVCGVALLVAVGCRTPITIDRSVGGARPVGCVPADCRALHSTIAITYLGVSGLLIEHEGHVLLTTPFFSNPSLGQVRPRVTKLLRSSPRIAPDTSLVERFLPHG